METTKKELEWYKFCEKWPKWDDFPIWKADLDSQKIYIYDNAAQLNAAELFAIPPLVKKELLWASASLNYPPLPKKQRHQCGNDPFIDANDRALLCYEDEHGLLWLRGLHYAWAVKVCPFCGYKPEEPNGN